MTHSEAINLVRLFYSCEWANRTKAVESLSGSDIDRWVQTFLPYEPDEIEAVIKSLQLTHSFIPTLNQFYESFLGHRQQKLEYMGVLKSPSEAWEKFRNNRHKYTHPRLSQVIVKNDPVLTATIKRLGGVGYVQGVDVTTNASRETFMDVYLEFTRKLNKAVAALPNLENVNELLKDTEYRPSQLRDGRKPTNPNLLGKSSVAS